VGGIWTEEQTALGREEHPMEQHHEFMKDVALQNSGECPFGHRDRVVPTTSDLPGFREGMGDWWCLKHEIQFGKREETP